MKALLIALNLSLVACALAATVLHRAGLGGEELADSYRVYQKRLAALAEEIDGTLVYQRRSKEDKTATSIWQKSLDSSQPTRLAESGRIPRWSPDGNHVVFLRDDTVCVVDRKTREVRDVITLPGVESAVYADTQTLTVCGSSDDGWVKQVDLATAETTLLLSGHAFMSAEIIPNTPYVAATIRGSSGAYFAFRFTIGNEKRLKHLKGLGTPVSLSPAGDRMIFNRTTLAEARILDVDSRKTLAKVPAPEGRRVLNHQWSNHPDYIVSTSKDFGNNVFIHGLADGKIIQATKPADTNYPDLWINQ